MGEDWWERENPGSQNYELLLDICKEFLERAVPQNCKLTTPFEFQNQLDIHFLLLCMNFS